MPFPCCKHHIAFASGQLLPIILGASLPGAEPACVHSIVTSEMKKRSAVLQDALASRGRQYRAYTLLDSSQQSIFALLDAVREECGGQSLGFNLTGGTKLMALAAAEWAYACDVPMFYIDTGAEKIVLPGRQWDYLPLPDVLDVSGLLAAGGYKIKDCTRDAVPGERRALLLEMLQLLCTVPDAGRALQRLNACAQAAKNTADRMAEDRGAPSRIWKNLWGLCQDAGMLDYGNGYIYFPSEEARQWCNGIWFEEFVRMTLYKMQGDRQIKSWASSVQVEKEHVPNELDALFCVRNRLFVIECKTAGMITGKSIGEYNKVTSILYKADSLHDRLGGILAQAIICSVLPLGEHERKRAKSIGIHIVSGRDLLRLEDILLRWAHSSI